MRYIALIVVVLLASTLDRVAGQGLSGQISGHVDDASGRSIVRLREIQTDSSGASVE